MTKNKKVIHTDHAPAPIGCYSQAVKIDDLATKTEGVGTVYLSGQIGLEPESMQLANGFEMQTRQMFTNLRNVCIAAGGDINDIVKLNLYLLDMQNFAMVNQIMAEFFVEPYPARAAIAVKELPKGALIEADGVMIL